MLHTGHWVNINHSCTIIKCQSILSRIKSKYFAYLILRSNAFKCQPLGQILTDHAEFINLAFFLVHCFRNAFIHILSLVYFVNVCPSSGNFLPSSRMLDGISVVSQNNQKQNIQFGLSKKCVVEVMPWGGWPSPSQRGHIALDLCYIIHMIVMLLYTLSGSKLMTFFKSYFLYGIQPKLVTLNVLFCSKIYLHLLAHLTNMIWTFLSQNYGSVVG